MVRRFTIKDSYLENRLIINRVVAALVVILFLNLLLAGRLIYLQISGHEHYSSLSQNNRIKISPLQPTRGLIFDRQGEILAQNITTYSLELIPEQVGNLEETLTGLQRLLDIDDREIEQFRRLRKRSKRFASIPLKWRMTERELAKFSVRRFQFPGAEVHARLARDYPYGNILAHVVGYVGRINEKELKSVDPAAYRGTNHIGKTGIEASYETMLHGKAGYEEIETNAQGRLINRLGQIPPESGVNLHLTLDIQMQKAAYNGLGTHNGAVVAIEAKTGNILVFTSKPGFDPNPFVHGIPVKDYDLLRSSADRPLFDRALRGQYPPGSTVKPFIGLAGLEHGVVDMRHSIFCPGFYQLPNVSHKYRDWKTWGHGHVDMNAAITQSCDVYFYGLAYSLGIERLSGFLKKFGFGSKTGIDLSGEKAGLLPSRKWKRKARNEPWYPGETLIAGIGQGFIQVTPLQLANATAQLANRGKAVRPHLVRRIERKAESMIPLQQFSPDIQIDPRNAESIIQAMVNVVHGDRGTAHSISNGIDYKIAGKTGTAQVFTVKQEENYDESRIDKKLRDHALFMAFAPANNPRIAIAVVVENGGHGGSVAAPIAKQVIHRYLGRES